MNINKVTIENFGLYSGLQEINLKTNSSQNIILIGGKNGNGKTTFFEAIRFCLYGPAMFEKRLTSKEYETYLRERIHHNNNAKPQATKARIEIEFEHTQLGTAEIYTVKREWELLNDNMKEQLTVTKDGTALNEIDADQWQNFVNDLIPPGLSELFFFDGEKIQRLADDETDKQQLADSFKSLLGIDIVEKLESDLELYSIKQLKESGTKKLSDEISLLESQRDESQQTIDDINQDRAQLQSRIANIKSSVDRQEHQLNSEGGTFAAKREDLKIYKTKIDTEIFAFEEQLRNSCAGILPFVFAQKLSIKLRDRLIMEEEQRAESIMHTSVQRKISRLNKELANTEFWQGTTVKKSDMTLLSDRLKSVLESTFITRAVQQHPVHSLSSEEHHRITLLIEQATTTAPKSLIDTVKKHEALIRKRQTVQKALGFAAPDQIANKYLSEINQLHQELGSLNQQLKNKEEEIRSALFQQQSIHRKLEKMIEELSAADDTTGRIKTAGKVRAALAEYYEDLKRSKIGGFARLFLESYDQIARKKNVFSRIEVSPVTFEVTVYKKIRGGERKVSKKELSAGEKQIYAISVLWALTKMSKRKLPFIIDTPLGRLDRDHRNNLALNFFPLASHQLVILSTDTEIDTQYFETLKPRIAKSFKLDYDEGETHIREGYFWS